MCTFNEKRVWSYAWNVMDDLSSVPREYIIDYLLERLQHGQIYTWVGTVLLAINPNDENISTEDIYNISRADSYRNARTTSCKDIQPHIFAVAARAHYRLIQDLGKPTQVIVLNGETGTGKTFNAWKALEFLIATAIENTSIREIDTSYDIVRKIKDACRLISAFTTAPTEKNEVSSRHIQVVWLEYKKNNICGAKISSYLLERNRVTKGYCTYQIFNQMMTALADIEFADTELSREKQYFIVSGLNFLKEQQFHEGFRDTLRAMDMLGFTIDQKRNIFQVLSLIIHMGNIQFIQEDDCCRIDTDNRQSKEAFENTCRLACLKKEDLAELLTSILISPRSRHSMCRRNLSTQDACYHRLHSIIRHLYNLLFCWLIKFVNEILSARLCQSNRLGILDIFGFECFNVNGIEQLSVNYVNEKLQQYFIEKYVTFCRRDLQEENLIEEKSLNFYNILQLYEDRLSIIKKKLFAVLNDTCLSTVPSNTCTLIRHVNNLLNSNHSTTRRFLKIKDENFIIRHYAGRVEYCGNDLFSKNIDKVPDELTITFSMSKNKFLYSLIIENDACEKPYVKKHTMLSKLCYNADWLIQELNKCDAHYVRCIKPRRLRNTDWDRDGLHKQLANTGTLHVLPLAKCKYPIYFPYEDFYKRYYGNYGKLTKTCDITSKISELLSSMAIKDINSAIHYGKNFIFLKEDLFLILEFTRRQCHIKSVKKIEAFWIKYKRKIVSETGKNPENTQQLKVEKIDTPINISETDVPSEDNKRKDVITQNYEMNSQLFTYEINLASLQHDRQKLNIKTDNVKKNSTQDISIQNYQLENNENNHKPTMDCIKTDQERNLITQIPQTIYNKLGHKTTYIMKWLKDVNKTANITSNIASTISKYSSVAHDPNPSTNINCNKNDLSQSMNFNNDHARRKSEKNLSFYYDKENDVYIIPHNGSILFYKNRILSRRRPTRLPVKVHTRVTCLTNSHYSIHAELPQGLQDCL